MEVQIDDEIVVANKNDLLIINQREYHRVKTVKEDARTLCIMFRVNLFNSVIVEDYIYPFFYKTNFSYALLHPTPMLNKKTEKIRESTQSQINYLSVLTLISSVLEETIQESKSNYSRSNQENKNIFNTLLNYVEKNYPCVITVEDLCKTVSINRNRCTDLFHKFTNTSPMKYVNDYRLHQARSLVINTDKSIEAISHSSGFNNLSYFSTQFKNKYQLSPMQYRQKFQ